MILGLRKPTNRPSRVKKKTALKKTLPLLEKTLINVCVRFGRSQTTNDPPPPLKEMSTVNKHGLQRGLEVGG